MPFFRVECPGDKIGAAILLFVLRIFLFRNRLECRQIRFAFLGKTFSAAGGRGITAPSFFRLHADPAFAGSVVFPETTYLLRPGKTLYHMLGVDIDT